MGKKRIHELAKELSLTSAELIQKITEWKLLPGVKLVASSGLEEYLIEEVSRRLERPVGGEASSSSPQVVRRRKKSAAEPVDDAESEIKTAKAANDDDDDDDDDAGSPGATEAAPAINAVKSEPDSVAVISKPAGFAEATIAAAPSSRLKDAKVKNNVSATIIGSKPLQTRATPDFLKLSPALEKAPAVSEERALTPSPAAPASSEAKTSLAAARIAPASTAHKPDKVKTSPSLPPQQSASVTPTAPRKVTRELSGESPARIISQPRSGFEAAKVVGSKPNWKDAAGGPRPGGGFPRRPGGAEGGAADWTAKRPAGDAARSLRPDLRRPDPAAMAVAPVPPETETRRRDKKKKIHGGGSRFEGDENQAAGKAVRRRDVVERTDLYSEGDWERVRRRNKNVKKTKSKTEITVPKAIKRRIKVDEVITVSELAHRLSIKVGDIIKKLMNMGVVASLNQALDFDTATLVSAEFGYEVERSSFDEENIMQVDYGDSSPESTRPPVVTIMGHVDHGKTSLLDYIRKTNIQSGEAGGITQHIGAYHVRAGGRNITFLDTPGHEAFTAMRSRGAQVTDIVILIVAADDGVMPQTREAADHAKAAGVPIIVAINKIDKPGADVEKVRREMAEIGLAPESWGGDAVFVEISAKSGQGVGELLDMILLQADILELKARPDGLAKGRIIEARLDKGRGPVATVMVQEGLLKQGDTYVCGVFYGRIRAMLDDQGERVAEAGPAIPVEVQGISGVPQAGDEFIVLADEKQARQVSQHRLLRQRESELTQTSKLTLENLFDNIKAGAVKGLNLIVKTDVQGSLEAIVDAVMNLSTSEMKINVIHQSTGSVSETDIMLASASHALVICFNVRPSGKVQELAEAEHIQIRYYDVIYKLIDDIKEAMAGLLDPVKSEKVLGRAEVRATFIVTKVGAIAGSYVTDGKITRGARARLLRDGVVVHDGRLSSLKRMKDDAREVSSGYECGIGFENYNDVKIGDHIEAYQVEETAATVELIDEALARAAKDRAAAAKEAAREKAGSEG
ncbi:MAG: translation initiation factor IF-2 [Candidatus Adiutrix sp.]|nr:translation initiation factor IF-2 [Candidatus Adiutrix sp.]